ncbi:lysophospholipase L1-like esterase [Opitutaceae bacterium TAV1]|nr:lysophospholipase L1-like esterase [Opitutaceae bacterium TAV1]
MLCMWSATDGVVRGPGLRRGLALFFLVLAATGGAVRPGSAQPAATPATRTILFFGDSLTAGYGLEDPATQAFPGLVQQRIEAAAAENAPAPAGAWRVVNAGLSGETSAGGLRRIDWILRQPVDVFVLELGGNDGLRGLSPEMTKQNLQGIIDKVRAKNPSTRIVIAGMQMPASMGDYAPAFAAVFPELAKANRATLIPFLLEGVGGRPELNLDDGFHPNAAGHRLVADVVWKALEPVLREP